MNLIAGLYNARGVILAAAELCSLHHYPATTGQLRIANEQVLKAQQLVERITQLMAEPEWSPDTLDAIREAMVDAGVEFAPQ